MSRQVDKRSHLINAGKGRPIYRQVACALETMISKEFEVGDYLPSENELSLHFNVNRHTVRRAVDDLVAAGFILRQQGKRSLIINDQIEYSLNSGRFTASLDKLRRNTSSQLIKSDLVPSNPKIANYLGIKEGAAVIVIETLRFVDSQPISLITHFLNSQYVPNIQGIYEGGSLHQCIEDHYQLKLKRTSALISAVMPTKEDAFQLKSSLTQPLLKIKSFNAIESDVEKIVEVSISRNRSDRFQIKVPYL
ncbi:MAG: phosphonate metabolism transcriptional regulator PhnF [Cellvibrionaceae bacterium]